MKKNSLIGSCWRVSLSWLRLLIILAQTSHTNFQNAQKSKIWKLHRKKKDFANETSQKNSNQITKISERKTKTVDGRKTPEPLLLQVFNDLSTPQRLFCELAGTKFCLENFKISNCKASQPYFTEIRNRNSFSVKEKLLWEGKETHAREEETNREKLCGTGEEREG